MNQDQCFLLGKITKPFSFKGEVVLWMDVDDKAAYMDVTTLWIPQQSILVPYAVESIKVNKDRFVVRLSDVNTEDQAKGLAGKDVWLPLSDMAPLPEGKFYFHEVQGWTAVDRASDEAVGTILHVVDQGAYPMLEVDFGEGNTGFIPLPEHVTIDVKRDAQTLVLDLPDGLLDVYLGKDDPEMDGDDDWEVPV
ncbi:MAG: ribosome maturation factor RimM [Bacteroidota bacterium]|nr:ribosome maturation factor RimM [Bacteroidota bacterium]